MSTKQTYEILNHGDIVQDGDEFLQDDCVTWKKTTSLFVGHKYNVYFHQPCRRPIDVDVERDMRIKKGLEIAMQVYDEHQKNCLCPADGHSEMCPVHKTQSALR